MSGWDAEAVLGVGGAVARALGDGYEPRPEQIAMADGVARAFDSRSHLVIEAGTGVGKSFAYLAPAMERCVTRGETVVVATNTIALQEQLVRKDVPLLEAALGVGVEEGAERPWVGAFGEMAQPLKAVLVKGRGNYVSIRRLKLASERQERLFGDAPSRRSLHVIEDWAYETDDGTLSTLPAMERPGVWDRVQSDSGNCMGRKCPSFKACFYQRARREMERANLLICNHAVFFSDLAMRARSDGEIGFLPRYQHVVLDEAHMVEDVASENFGLSVSEGRVNHLLSLLYQRRTNKGYLAQLKLAGDGLEAVEKAVSLVAEAEEVSRGFFDDLVALVESGAAPGGRVRGADAVENGLSPVMERLAVQLRRLKDETEREADRFELNAYAIRAAEIADQAKALVGQHEADACYWIEAGSRMAAGPGRRGGRRKVELAGSRVVVGPVLKEELFGRDWSVVLTSATLATRRVEPGEPAERAEAAFTHFMSRTGCEGAETVQLGSPFDHAGQVAFYVDRTMAAPEAASRKSRRGGENGSGAGPIPQMDRGPAYVRGLVARVLDHVVATEGGAFVLFTSYSLLDRVAAELAEPLETLGYPMFVQGRGPGAGSRGELLEAFRASGDGVLLGAASFWQGVDVRGEALRNVIITKLPFEPPDRPLTEARLERIRERGGDPFREDSLPRAVIRFKQGIGRLVRSHGDRGRLVVLDPRIVTKSYGRAFVAALPEGVEVREVGAGEDLV